MFEDCSHCLPHLLQEPREGGVLGNVGAQHQGVDEEADQGLQLLATAPGFGRAHADVILAGVAVEQDIVCSQQGHEGRRSELLPQRRQFFCNESRDFKVNMIPAEGGDRGTGMVQGQFQRRRAAIAQLLSPEGQLLLQAFALQQFALPDGVVGILDAQGRQIGLDSTDECVVEPAQLADEHRHAPAIGDDVVHGEQGRMFIFIQA